MKRPSVINGGRAALERELLEALFTNVEADRAEKLKMRLAPRGCSRMKLVCDRTPHPPSRKPADE